jgi:hypothetical protein
MLKYKNVFLMVDRCILKDTKVFLGEVTKCWFEYPRAR